MNRLNKISVGCLIAFIWGIQATSIYAQQTDDQNFKTSKNLDIFNSLFKELTMFYVDSIDADKSVQTAIRAMLDELDPYTVYYPEDKVSDLKFMTTGEYAGIGAMIMQRDGKIMISEPYEDMPAAKNGLQAGDVLLEIDGVILAGKDNSFASEKLKGQPNTIVKIKYQREGDSKPRSVEIKRELIHINSIPYYGIVKDSTGYIFLSSFTEKSAAEVKLAFEDLKSKQGITSLILDLRNNGGGLMDDAIQLVNLFIPKGEIVVSTKGRIKQWDRTYRTTQNSIDEKIPLVVLVNSYTASSSEITAGALQDLDRAVLVGSRTYGKGLVQVPREIAYNGNLKVTISKYYIPSGRCIQAIDYSHKQEDGKAQAIPDSLTNTFYTSKGRPVKDGGGITPDITVEDEKMPTIIYYLLTENILFDFATSWKIKHKTIDSAEKFNLTDQDYEEFRAFVKNKNFDYDRQSEKALSALKEVMQFEGYTSQAENEIKALEEKLKPNLDKDLDLYKNEISQQLAIEIIKRYYYQKGEVIQSLKDDPCITKALETISDTEKYNKILNIN